MNWYLCDKNSQKVMIIPITIRKIKSVKVSLFVYPPKYGYFELSVFDYELLCLNGARSWTSLQFVQVRTSPTSHAATTFWSRSFVASLSTRYWQVTTLYRVLHAQLSEDAPNTAFLVCTVLRGTASLNLYGRKNRAACQIPPDKSIWENLTKTAAPRKRSNICPHTFSRQNRAIVQ